LQLDYLKLLICLAAESSFFLTWSAVSFENKKIEVCETKNEKQSHKIEIKEWLKFKVNPFITLCLECVATTLKSHVKGSSGYAF
jgi:hypothetical protein